MLANAKKKKGFTLVEVIIVLVIIAILAAVLIPSLTGYIDKANEKAAITKARNFVMAAQTIASEAYGEGKVANLDTTKNTSSTFILDAFKLSEVSTDGTGYKVTVKMTTKGKITEVIFADGTYVVTYKDGGFSVTGTAPASNSVTVSDT